MAYEYKFEKKLRTLGKKLGAPGGMKKRTVKKVKASTRGAKKNIRQAKRAGLITGQKKRSLLKSARRRKRVDVKAVRTRKRTVRKVARKVKKAYKNIYKEGV